MKSYVIGNCAGNMSSFSKILAWMSIKEFEQNKNIDLRFHFTNKTNTNGNCLPMCPYNYTKYNNIPSDILNNNILNNFFIPNQYLNINTNIENNNFNIYTELWPYDRHDDDIYFPDFVHNPFYHVNAYTNKLNLNKTRNLFNKQWKKIQFSDRLNEKIQKNVKPLFEDNKKTLCIMIRTSLHYLNETYNDTNSFFDDIDKIIDLHEYDNILLVTQLQEVLDNFIIKYGDKCKYIKRNRLLSNIDWKGGRGEYMTNDEFLKEAEDALVDVISASRSDYILGGPSAMLLSALYMNTEINFEFFNVLKNSIGS